MVPRAPSDVIPLPVIAPGGVGTSNDSQVTDSLGQSRIATEDGTARGRILELIASDGPVSATDLADRLAVTPAAVRRQIALLEHDELIAVHEPAPGARMRGRPARLYVTTARGQAELSGAYADLAAEVLRFLRSTSGPDAVHEFARNRLADLSKRYASRVDADDVTERAAQLARALATDGYAATLRPVPGGFAVQLCQGHCPVQHVAEEFPELCEAETQAFSALLGSHVQRLATLATGAHACTTNVPVAVAHPESDQGHERVSDDL